MSFFLVGVIWSAQYVVSQAPDNPDCALFDQDLGSCATQYPAVAESYCVDQCVIVQNGPLYKCQNNVTQQLEYGGDWNLENRGMKSAPQGTGFAPESWHTSVCYVATPCKCSQITGGTAYNCIVDTFAEPTRAYRLSGTYNVNAPTPCTVTIPLPGGP